MGMPVKQGDTIKVHYTGRFEDGVIFDSSVGGEPLEFTLGSHEVIPGFEKAAEGMNIGESKTISIEPEHAYGSYNENLVVDMPKEYFPEDIEPEVGMRLIIVDNSGEELPVVVSEIQNESVRLDANHPLAGKTLVFDIELVDIL
ncbi:MAG: FKBP-type peptidyl-prolyl cis-trans isomerase SlyD [Deltaproteobacteria bacterium ADurb.BinA179]|jgi:FKBP-type peptidyl-prolyl cis-trans isomerase 2|nr:MAG: FKBP-type peptidyl-prolyl cis-trans isomerase SlyD [Deltaproteobacteria bacterium ADurb.BinA179]